MFSNVFENIRLFLCADLTLAVSPVVLSAALVFHGQSFASIDGAHHIYTAWIQDCGVQASSDGIGHTVDIYIFSGGHLKGDVKKGDMLWVPIHIPPFLSPKHFDEFYWPSFKKVIDYGLKKGIKFILGLEGDWTHHIEKLKEFPKNSFLCTIEDTDIFWAKKVVGDHVTLIGGMRSNLLRGDDKEACVNLTKKLIDECGPGGGYFFCIDKMLMSPGDLKLENYNACIDTILSYK